MKNSDSSEDAIPKSGNIFGWRISFISLGIILVTLVAVIITEGGKSKVPSSATSTVVDSIEVERVDSIRIEGNGN